MLIRRTRTLHKGHRGLSWGAYTRLCLARSSRKTPTRTPATTRHGTKVETKADSDEEPPRWRPCCEFEPDEDMFVDEQSRCRDAGRCANREQRRLSPSDVTDFMVLTAS